MMNKENLRTELKNERKALTHQEILALSRKIEKNLFTLDEINNSSAVMVYNAAFNEPRTLRITQKLLNDGKRVFLPITSITDRKITPSEMFDDDEFKVGAYGILEPKKERPTDKSEIDVVLLPGMGFDRNGNRMGFGGGYYDRFLQDYAGIKIGICYSFQIVEKIPTQSTDIPVDFIVTENEVYRV